jgi:outer membrane protein assembly factor BamB
MNYRYHHLFTVPLLAIAMTVSLLSTVVSGQRLAADQPNLKSYGIPTLKVGPGDWPQWGGSSLRNNTPVGKNIPSRWNTETGENIKWSAKLGSQTYPCPVVANGKIFIGTNNRTGYLPRFPGTVDLGCLLCFDEKTGKFIWQHSNRKLKTGRVHDYPFQGIVAVPVVDGDRLWYVTNRGEVVCLDTEGFTDQENDGPYRQEEVVAENEADVIWKFDMMAELGTRQHNMCTCSLTCAGDVLFVVTSNGVDSSHVNLPALNAPAFLALDRNTAKVLWTDNSPGKNVLHGSWSSPSYAVLGGQPQVLFPGGDGWLYSFAPQGDGKGKSKLLWKFDCNPKESKWRLGGHGTRSPFITLPVIYDNRVYVAVGQDVEHGEGVGHLWCIDPTKKLDGSDVSPTLAYDAAGKRMPHKRRQAVNPKSGESARPNANSAVVWHYDKFDLDGNGKIGFAETMHRSCGNVAIKDDLLFIADLSGIVHCVNARTGKSYWTHDLFASAWAASPLIVDGKVYIGDEDGDVIIFKLSPKKQIVNEVNMGNALYSTPIVANNVLYIANKSTLYAIAE